MVTFKKEELMEIQNSVLSEMCKKRGIRLYKGIRGKTHLNKTDMVECLLEWAEKNPNGLSESEGPVDNVPEEKETVTPEPVVEQTEEVVEEQNSPWVVGDKDDFIDNAEVGTLIAFLDLKGKPRTGKLVNRSSSRRMVKLVTEFDAEFIVSYDNVLWVRNGTRWPKAVYTMLKEYKNGKPVIVTLWKPEQGEESQLQTEQD